VNATTAVEVRNEFAAVDISLDGTANAPRLRIRDLETGLVCCVDAYVLRSLVLASPAALRGLCRATVPTGGDSGGAVGSGEQGSGDHGLPGHEGQDLLLPRHRRPVP